jgi:hypothetical protein
MGKETTYREGNLVTHVSVDSFEIWRRNLLHIIIDRKPIY